MSNSRDIFQDVCRVCAKKSVTTINLFSARKKGLILADILAICAQIQIRQHDIRPPSICNQCLSKLEVAFELYSLAKLSENHFKKMVSTYSKQRAVDVIKFEPIEIDEPILIDDECSSNQNTTVINESHNKVCTTERTPIQPRQHQSTEYQRPAEQQILFECFMCRATFNSVKETRKHLQQHNGASSFQCEVCALTFTAERFERHLCRGQSVNCDHCAESFETTKGFLDHFRQEHKHEHRPYKCSYCSKAFPLLFLLECHQPQHKAANKPHVCHVCNRTFPFNYALKKHVQLKHSDYRPYLCSTCGKGFKTVHSMKSHILRHTGDKPIACSKCPMRFYNMADLRKHMDLHNDTKYVCSLCGTTLNSKHSLNEHTRNLHRKADDQSCDICSKKFSLKSLKRHMLTHTGEKPHKCTYCDRAFRQSNDLNKHLRSHVGEKTYQCGQCPKAFRLQIELRKHSYEHFQSENQTNMDTV